MKWSLVLGFLLAIPFVEAVVIPHPLSVTEDISWWYVIVLILLLSVISFAFTSWMNNRTSIIKEGNVWWELGLSLTLAIILMYLFPFSTWISNSFSLLIKSIPTLVLVVILLLLFFAWMVLIIIHNLKRNDIMWLHDEQYLEKVPGIVARKELMRSKRLEHLLAHLPRKYVHQFEFDGILPKPVKKVFDRRRKIAQRASSPGTLTIHQIVKVTEDLLSLIPVSSEAQPYFASHEGKGLLKDIANQMRVLRQHLNSEKMKEEKGIDALLTELDDLKKQVSKAEKKELKFLIDGAIDRELNIRSALFGLLQDAENKLLQKRADPRKVAQTIAPDLLNLQEALLDMVKGVRHIQAMKRRLWRKQGIVKLFSHRWKQTLQKISLLFSGKKRKT
tara:strand:+ start:162 stop:1328 length:1167 start_codon:yes stop_codon:yes gene_type:complete